MKQPSPYRPRPSLALDPVTLELWRRGVQTISSCEHQEGTDVALIGFPTKAEAERAAPLLGGLVIVPTLLDYANASLASAWAGYSVPGSAIVVIPADSLREVTRRVKRSR